MELVGEDAARMIIRQHGGTRLYVPVVAAPAHPISKLIGVRRAAHLSEQLGGTTIEVPKAHARRALAMQLLEEGEMTVPQIAVATDYTERQVYRFLAELRFDDRQMDLFDSL